MHSLVAQVMEIATTGGHLSVSCAASPARLGAPGQFFLAAARGAGAPFLRAPLFPFTTQAERWEFWAAPTHPLAQLQPGDELDLLGPLGHGFHLPSGASRLLLYSAAVERLFPLMFWALAHQWAVVWLIPEGAPAWPLPVLPSAVEVQRGSFTAELAEWAEVAALDVPEPGQAARALRALCPPRPAAFVQALITPTMPCGVGACQACWVNLPRGRKLACGDGPVMMI